MMFSEPAMDAARDVALALFEAATEMVPTEEWSKVTLDARYDGSGGFEHKIRICLHDPESGTKSLLSNDRIDIPLLALDKHRADMGTEWHSLHYTVTSNCEVSIDLGYKKANGDDATFYED